MSAMCSPCVDYDYHIILYDNEQLLKTKSRLVFVHRDILENILLDRQSILLTP